MRVNPRLLLLNGVPGAGKSTLASRYAEDHPGVLICDIDRLRTMVAGWQDDFAGTGRLVRAAARAFLTAYLAEGGDVVVPQLVGNVRELDGFAEAAASAGASFVHVLLDVPVAEVTSRFAGRTEGEWLPQVRRLVAETAVTTPCSRGTTDCPRCAGSARSSLVVPSVSGDVEATYAALCGVVRGRRAREPRICEVVGVPEGPRTPTTQQMR